MLGPNQHSSTLSQPTSIPPTTQNLYGANFPVFGRASTHAFVQTKRVTESGIHMRAMRHFSLLLRRDVEPMSMRCDVDALTFRRATSIQTPNKTSENEQFSECEILSCQWIFLALAVTQFSASVVDATALEILHSYEKQRIVIAHSIQT